MSTIHYSIEIIHGNALYLIHFSIRKKIKKFFLYLIHFLKGRKIKNKIFYLLLINIYYHSI